MSWFMRGRFEGGGGSPRAKTKFASPVRRRISCRVQQQGAQRKVESKKRMRWVRKAQRPLGEDLDETTVRETTWSPDRSVEEEAGRSCPLQNLVQV